MAGKDIVALSVDSHLTFINAEKFAFDGDAIKLNGCPSDAVATSDGETIIVACHTGIQILNGKKITGFTATKFEPTCLTLASDDKTLIVGGSDKKLRVYEVKKDGVVEQKVFGDVHTSKLTSIKISPDGSMIASGDAGREVVVWNAGDWTPKYTQMAFHTSSITDLSWSPDSKHLLSGSLDGNLIIWDLQNGKRIVQGAHRHGTKAVSYINQDTVLTAGGDFRIRSFSYAF